MACICDAAFEVTSRIASHKHSIALLAFLSYCPLGLTSDCSSCALHLVDGLVGCAIDHSDIRRDRRAKELLIQLHGTLGLGQEQEKEESELDGVVERHPEENVLQETLDEAEARVHDPIGEPQTVFIGILGLQGVERCISWVHKPHKVTEQTSSETKQDEDHNEDRNASSDVQLLHSCLVLQCLECVNLVK